MKQEGVPFPRIPVSTYRLQFNHLFRFSDAAGIIPYLHEMGITDIYSSPYCKARRGSLHGYDIVDPNVLNPEVGTEKEYDEFADAIKACGMGQILDVVPNHMCIESDNPWWMDVLENGPSSLYAHFFDIDWSPIVKKLTGRILIPLLGDQYGRVLERQELRLAFAEGAFSVSYHDNKFPVLPDSYVHILQHHIEDLENRMSKDNPDLVELLSIVSALKHLPPCSETDPKRVAERYREKELIKKRLFTLYHDCPVMKSFIDENVREFNGSKSDPKSFTLLDELLGEQVWRLSHWRVAMEEINYRRFFDINNIAAVHMENPAVFRETHKLVFTLIAGGKVTGLRVDHADGLYNPSEYLKRLQKNCFIRIVRASPGNMGPAGQEQPDQEMQIIPRYNEILSSDHRFKPCYIVAEKILTRGEKMPDEWPVFGATGYVFLNSLNGIFVDSRNSKAFDRLYAQFIKSNINFQDVMYERKKLVMQVAMSGEISTLGHYLNTISEKNRHTRDFTLNSLTRAIVEVIAFFPVYRTYVTTWDVDDRDRQYIETAVAKARRKNPAISSFIFDFLRDVLLLRFPDGFGEEDKQEWLDFVMRFQQITSPVMAKGLEDTAFYIYNRFVSLNEVGGSPDRFGLSLEAFHGQNLDRLKFWPHSLIATSTHDTKRSEDVRARINVLSEIPDQWKERLMRWSRLNRKRKAALEGQAVPDRNEEYLLYQTLVGAWPVGPVSEPEYEIFKTRIRDYMVKAIREAKINTSWISPNAAYEEALVSFIDAIMTDTADNTFLKEFEPFQKMISHYGMFNSLSQTLLKITSPGVPDIYQGTEVWDFSLVDPDNRRPVAFAERIRLFGELRKSESKIEPRKLAGDLTAKKNDGRIKLYLTYKALRYRRENRELFDNGEYIPLEAAGEKAHHVCAFGRRTGNSEALIVAPRFLATLMQDGEEIPFGEKVWEDTRIMIPFEGAGMPFHNVFTGEIVSTMSRNGAAVLHLRDIFSSFPAALLSNIEGRGRSAT